MTAKMKYLQYVSVLMCGILLGWVIQPQVTINGLSEDSNNHADPQIEAQQADEIMLNSARTNTPSHPSNSQPNHQTTTSEQVVSSAIAQYFEKWSGQQLIEHLASLQDEVFWERINSGEIQAALKNSPALLDDFMSQVLDEHDESVVRRIKYLVQLGLTNHDINQEGKNPIEQWIMQKVDSDDRSTEWLSYLGQFGVSDKDNYLSLAGRLREYTPPEHVNSLLTLIARKNYTLETLLSDEERNYVDEAIQPYFNSEEPVEKILALSSVTGRPFEQNKARIHNALDDPSLKVRMSTMRIIRDNRFSSPQISSSLMAKLSNKSLSAYERLGAYEVLSRFNLSQEQYETVYQFAAQDRVALEKEFRANRQAAANANQ